MQSTQRKILILLVILMPYPRITIHPTITAAPTPQLTQSTLTSLPQATIFTPTAIIIDLIQFKCLIIRLIIASQFQYQLSVSFTQ